MTVLHNEIRLDVNGLLSTPSKFGQKGLWSLCARNASGKSTILNLLEERMGERAHLTSENHSGFLGEVARSAGASALQKLREATQLEALDVLLFDEPLANLDHEKKRDAVRLLQDAANDKTVIVSCVGNHAGDLCPYFDDRLAHREARPEIARYEQVRPGA